MTPAEEFGIRQHEQDFQVALTCRVKASREHIFWKFRFDRLFRRNFDEYFEPPV